VSTQSSHIPLTVTFAALAVLSLVNQVVSSSATAAPITAMWLFLAFLAFKGRLLQVSQWLRGLVLLLGCVLFVIFIAVDDDIAKTLGYDSKSEILVNGFLSFAVTFGILIYLSQILKKTLSEILFGTGIEANASMTSVDSEQIVEMAPTVVSTEPMNDEPYGEALAEYESPHRDKNLYAKLLVECDGDEAKVRARYVAAKVSAGRLSKQTVQSAPPTASTVESGRKIEEKPITAETIPEETIILCFIAVVVLIIVIAILVATLD